MERHFLDARIVQRRDVIKRYVEIREIESRLVFHGEAGQVGLRIDEGWRIELAKYAIDIIVTGAEFELAVAVDRNPKTRAGLRPAALTDDVLGFGLDAID